MQASAKEMIWKNQRHMGHNGSPEWTALKTLVSILEFQLPWQMFAKNSAVR